MVFYTYLSTRIDFTLDPLHCGLLQHFQGAALLIVVYGHLLVLGALGERATRSFQMLRRIVVLCCEGVRVVAIDHRVRAVPDWLGCLWHQIVRLGGEDIDPKELNRIAGVIHYFHLYAPFRPGVPLTDIKQREGQDA